MIVAAPVNLEADVELGGGFAYRRRNDGEAAVTTPPLADSCATLMSTVHINARDEGALGTWLRRWNVWPAHGLRGVDQVHGTRVVRVSETERLVKPAADGMWTSLPSVALIVKAADCAPIWLVERTSKRLAVLHAGWRGVAAGIIDHAIMALTGDGSPERNTKSHPGADITVAVGPHLQACCFEVGPDVAADFAAVEGAVLPAEHLIVTRQRDDSVALNLGAAINAACRRHGVAAGAFFLSSACTRCHPEMFHSYRRNGTGGPLMAAVGMMRA